MHVHGQMHVQDARTWALPYLEELGRGRQPFKGDWAEFEKAFTQRFMPQDSQEVTRKAVMIRSDFTLLRSYVRLHRFLLFLPNTEAHVRYNLVAFPCTIQSGGFPLYDTISQSLLVRYPS